MYTNFQSYTLSSRCMHKMQLIINSSIISVNQYKNYMKINLFKKKASMYLEISYLQT